MNKLFAFTAAVLFSLAAFVLFSGAASAAPLDYNGGVYNEYAYEEYVFVSAEPVQFSGKVTISERETATQRTETYRYTLTGPGDKDKLTRSVSYVTNMNVKTEKGQTTSQTSVKSYSEKITIGSETYTLDDYQLSQGTITDNRPASDYYSGNMAGRKTYKLKSNGALVTIHFNGKNVGYENFWGATETQIIDSEIVTNEGTFFVTSKVSDSKTKFLQYEPHDPDLSSFTGGYARISEQSMIGEYAYTLLGSSIEKTVQVGQERVPLVERLIVPKFRDLNGHWAKENIEQLYALGVFDDSSSFFSPGTQMNRYPFIVGVMKAADIRVLEQPKKQKTPRKAIFTDLDPQEKDYLYIESAVAKGISKGYSATKFSPNSALTRAEAVAILIRALGLEHRAPDPGYHTGYVDDSSIPKWAKDSAYVATEIGLVYGDLNNRFNPTKPMTRAEASALTIRFLHFLEKDLKQNYRDDMLFFQ
ncbi:S-layer homology domain-containing protein [Domibacillus sp. DTU_2020_1001157_1_SI_ALB_TIR_016]|uniref:S-layer homology domain-containing protein n=1 Tax=Domibacillus sp. DTU_2020_1001157_1_SI_ALB_TIR_016 TaxID=3077789 RepID=UPI0028E90A02|nr:S-layer homology domain-containing protein [Domibacillus sp. DTU_2020_1001157_1_SI_ALB_TIR_016]WNS82137.1 S-layer homology domain-containing protein [Domibacillus sp. DTU_2020_1001157_1_SI_ALB_TIR_016]